MTKIYRAVMAPGLPDLELRIYNVPDLDEVIDSPFSVTEAITIPGLYESNDPIELDAGNYLLHWRSAQQNAKVILEVN